MMDTPRIKMTHAYGEVAPNTFSDFDWARHNEKELLERYGECVAIIYEKRVVGTGETYTEAVENAERNLPAEFGVITPVLVFLHHRQPFYRVRPDPMSDDK